MSTLFEHPEREGDLLQLRTEPPAGFELIHGAAVDVESPTRIHPLVLLLLDRLQPAELQQLVAGLFESLSRLLDRLTLIESVLISAHPPQAALPLFHFLHEAADVFLMRLESESARPDIAGDELAEVLDGTCFALRHELRRVYEKEVLVVDVGQPTGQLRSELLRAHALLTNCLQQTYVNVARVFDKDTQATDLFTDVRLRREQSKVLYRHLLLLNALLTRAEREKDPYSYLALSKGLRIFVSEYMHLLMYKDWPEFEAITDSVLKTNNVAELSPLLGHFGSYLETLIRHVRLRAVFVEGT